MKTSIVSANWLNLVLAAVLAGSWGATATAHSQTNRLRVGVYDSRAVAIAYGNSTEFKEAMKPIEADHKKAREAKNEKRVKEIETQMQSRQRRAHDQAFSIGSVAPVMARVKNHLPDVAKQAGVQVIVSKWELNYQSPEVEVIDVTDQIVALFHVSEKGLQWSKEIQSKPPLPIEQLNERMD